MAIKDIPASTILDFQNLIAQAPAYIQALITQAQEKFLPTYRGNFQNIKITPQDAPKYAASRLSDWFNKTIKPNATSTKDATATISSTFTSIDDFNASFYNIRTAIILADTTAVAFLDTWFKNYSKLTYGIGRN